MKNRKNIITVVSCSLVVALLTALFFIVPDKELSQKENRTLSQVPNFNVQSLISGGYTAKLAEYISDQFPLRDTFVAVKAYSELCQGKRENNGVIYGKGGVLIARDTEFDNRTKENVQIIKEFETATKTSVCLGVLPRSIDVFSELLPKSYSTSCERELWQEYYNATAQNGLNAPDLYDALCKQNNYYHTDHHYNIYGAYQTYSILGNSLGYEPKNIELFNDEKIADDFCGTSMRASGFYLAAKDEMHLLRYDGDTDYKIVADQKEIELYDFSALDTTDKYAVFLGGNHARVDITAGEGRQKLLIIRDSFADSLAPFLALHYDLTLIDLRYFNGNVQQLVKDEGINSVLILESMSEFSTTKNLSYLRMTAQ